MNCPRCGAGNEPGAGFCHSCGAHLAPAPVTAPPLPPPAGWSPSSAPAPAYRGYFRALLIWGVALSVFGYVLIGQWVSSQSDNADYLSSNSGGDGGQAVLGFLLAGVGGVLLLPGIIGWGIHASGLTRPRGAPEANGGPRP